MKDDLRNDLRNVGGFLGWLLAPFVVVLAAVMILGSDGFARVVVLGFVAALVVAMIRQR